MGKQPKKWTASRIKALRKAYGESQNQWAVRLGVKLDTLQNWEQGRCPAPRISFMVFDGLFAALKPATRSSLTEL